MTVILLEALAALALFVLAVWWTMFAGRNKGELPPHYDAEKSSGTGAKPAAPSVEEDGEQAPGNTSN